MNNHWHWQVKQNECIVRNSVVENQSFKRSRNSNRHPKGSLSPNLNHCTNRRPWQLHFTHFFPFDETRLKQFSQVRKLPRPDAQSRGISAVIATKGPGQLSCHIQTEEYFWRNADATALPCFTLSTPPGKLLVSHAGPESGPALIGVSWQQSNVRPKGSTAVIKDLRCLLSQLFSVGHTNK